MTNDKDEPEMMCAHCFSTDYDIYEWDSTIETGWTYCQKCDFWTEHPKMELDAA